MRTTMVALAVLTVTAVATAQEKPAEEAKAARPTQRRTAEARDTRGPRSACCRTPTTSRPSTARASRRSARGRGCPTTPRTGSPTSTARTGRLPGTPHGWSAFWTNGYRAPRPAPFRPYRRSIGENGDLFLVVPFLAPVGPISGAFFGY